MEYPVYIQGKKCGRLDISKEGLYTYITADCEMIDGIVRLSIFGEGKSVSFGTLCPKDERLYLKKRYSDTELRRFPKNIDYAADVGIAKAEPEALDEVEGLLWFQTLSGSLTAFDGEKSLVAIPTDGKMKAGRHMKLDGKDYILFVAKRNLQ